jgi:hypothetical protein
VIDVHRRKAALVVMRVPERQLLAAMRRTEGVVDIEDLQPGAAASRAASILLGSFSRRQGEREVLDGTPSLGFASALHPSELR